MVINKEEFTALVLSGYTVKQLQDKYNLSRNSIYHYKNKWDLVGKTPNGKAKLPNKEGNKICTSCSIEKPITEFYSNGYQPNGKKKYKSFCKSCTNHKAYFDKVEKIKTILAALNLKYECINCGYNKNYAALCFHHKDEEDKDFELSQSSGKSLTELKLEIEKCDVLCHNCHMEKHYPHLTN